MLASDGTSEESVVNSLRHQLARLTTDLSTLEKNRSLDTSLRKDLDGLVQKVTTLTGKHDDLKKYVQDTKEEVQEMKVHVSTQVSLEVEEIKDEVFRDLSAQISSEVKKAVNKHVLDEELIAKISNNVLSSLSPQITFLVQEKVKTELQFITKQSTDPVLEGALPSDQYNANTTTVPTLKNLANQENINTTLPPLRRRRSSSLTKLRPRSYSFDSDYSSNRGSMMIDHLNGDLPMSPSHSSATQMVPEEMNV